MSSLCELPSPHHNSLLPQDAGVKSKQAAVGTTTAGSYLQVSEGRFLDDRWVGGRWVLSEFKQADGEMNWDLVSELGEHNGNGGIGVMLAQFSLQAMRLTKSGPLLRLTFEDHVSGPQTSKDDKQMTKFRQTVFNLGFSCLLSQKPIS